MSIYKVAYGGGLNSTAMIIGMLTKGVPIDIILFADTQGETPCTYQFINRFERWLIKEYGIEITRVHRVDFEGRPLSLEAFCLATKSLPALAYGFKTCSLKFKRQPCNKYMNNWQPAKAAWGRGDKVVKYIGFDINEQHRAERHRDDNKYDHEFPLIEWEWDRDRCKDEIKRVGLPVPPKSSCFFCPARKKNEILKLPEDLKQRAIAIERNALTFTAKGLGRYFAWENLIHADNAQIELFESKIEIDCECFDG